MSGRVFYETRLPSRHAADGDAADTAYLQAHAPIEAQANEIGIHAAD